MRSLLIPLLAVAAAFAATPAMADESFVETTGGVIWNRGETNAVAAVSVGHDIELNDRFFIGGEGFVEKILANGTRVVWGAGGRVGARIMAGSKLVAGVNWQSKDCRECSDAVGLSAGWEQDLNEKLFVKAEYKHLLVGNGERDFDLVAIGLGFRF